MLGLRKDEYKSGHPFISLQRSINVNGEHTQDKNENAIRDAVSHRSRTKRIEDQLAYLERMGIDSPWIFPGRDGGQGYEKGALAQWYNYRRGVGISLCTLYELRHTFVSICHSVPDALLKPEIGHSSAMDTRRVYGHEVDGQKKIAGAMIGNAFISALEQAENKANAGNSAGLA